MANEFVAKNGLISQNNSIVTGSLTVTGGITGSLLGTASLAINSTNAVTSAVATNVTVIDTTADIGTYYPTFVSTTAGNLAIRLDSTGLTYNPSNNSLSVTRVTASLFGTSSWASNATTASFALNANIFPFTGSALITGSLGVTGSLTVTQIGAGAAPSSSVRLDVRASSSAATDTVFRVRNSANTLDIIKANGRGDVFIGQGAGRLTTGISNTFMGLNAGSSNITGQENTAIGASAGQSSLGSYNTYLGNGAGQNGTTSEGSIFIGYGAGQNSNANYAVLIGYTAGTTAGNGSVAIGYNAGPGTGTHNQSIGQSAGSGMTTGAGNIHLGYRSVASGVTTGNYNTLIGGDSVVGNVSNTAVLSDGAGNIAIRKNASHLVGIGYGGTDTLGAKLDVKAQGSLSTDIAFRVRNSADTQNLMSITGDGRVAIGLNAQILGTTDAFKNVVIGGLARDISVAGVTENAVALGYNAVSNNGGTAIGANTQIVGATGTALGASAYAGIDSTAIGAGARADATSLYQSLAIGRGARASALLSGIIAVGQSSYTNALGQTLAFCVDPVGANSQTMLLTNRANLIFRNSTQLTSGTHWDTTATNTLTIHSGSIPVTTVSGAFQMYAATGSLTNNTRPHFRTGNGTIVWLGDESRLFNVTASNITASNITAASLTIPSGSITLTTGSITMPNRPAFRVTGAGGGKTAVTTLSGSYLNVDYQQGGGWDNSTGTFTAPIAGLYQVNLVTRTNSNSLGTISQLIVYKNNTGGTTGTPQVMIEYGINTSMNHVGGSTISKLAVGDTLKMVVAVGEISFDQNDNFSVAYIG
jgi:hypothetical protein